MATGKYGTNFMESEVILAAGEADEETVDDTLRDMGNGELKRLADAADFVSGRIDEILQERREKGE